MTRYIQLNRQFTLFSSTQDNPEANFDHFFYGRSSSNIIGWTDLLQKDKIVILAEAGSGKTEEIKHTARTLYDEGRASFFCRIEDLLESDFDPSLDWEIGCPDRFRNWKNSANDTAYFFLDSVDEAKLKQASAFRTALRRFARAIGQDNFVKAKIFVTSRFSEWRPISDLELFCQNFDIPIPTQPENSVVYKLEPLNDGQIHTFSSAQQVESPQAFLEAIERADAKLFAARPQDLLDLITYWNEKGVLPKHYKEIIDYSIRQKLKESNPDRVRQSDLSSDETLSAAKQLAAAATLTQKNKIRLPDCPSTHGLLRESFDPKQVLPDLSDAKLEELLSRPIFDEAIYGTARFHHRSVREYLTALWLYDLLQSNFSRRHVEGLLCIEKYGTEVAVPSMQPIAAWLAYWDEPIRNRLKRIAPEVLIEQGDPSGFPVTFRIQLLDQLVERYQEQQDTDLKIDPVMMKRLATADMADAINIRLRQFAEHQDLSHLFLNMVWYGEIVESVDEVSLIALSDSIHKRIRETALETILAVGDNAQKQLVIISLLQQGTAGCKILGSKCTELFPGYLSIYDLGDIIRAHPQTDRYWKPSLHYSLQHLAENHEIEDDTILSLLQELQTIYHQEPHQENYDRCNISELYGWITEEAVRFANQLLKRNSQHSFSSIVIHTFWAYFEFIKCSGDSHSFDSDPLTLSIKENREFCYRLFWYTASALQNTRFPHWHWIPISRGIQALWQPELSDWNKLINALEERPHGNERSIALTALYHLYREHEPSEQRLLQLQQAVLHDENLTSQLERTINPPPPTPEDIEHQQLEAEYAERRRKRKEEEEAIRADWLQHLQNNPSQLLELGDAGNGTIWQEGAYLYGRLRKNEDSITKHGLSNWESLINEFGEEVAINFRNGCIAYWRQYDPYSQADYRTSNETPYARLIGLSGLAMESRNSNWASNLTEREAQLATHYAIMELNGFPDWLIDIQRNHPLIIKAALLEEVRHELSPNFSGNYSKILQRMYFSRDFDASDFVEELLQLLERLSINTKHECIEYALGIIFKTNITDSMNQRLSALARQCLLKTQQLNTYIMWLYVLLSTNANDGIRICKTWLNMLPTEEARQTVANMIFTELGEDFHRHSRINAPTPDFQRPEILQTLTELANQYIRYEDDIHRGPGSYSPGPRDHAQRARESMLSAFAEIPKSKTYSTLLQWANYAHYQPHKDYLLRLAKQRLESDSEFAPWSESDVAEFSKSAEKKPNNERELFQLAVNRLLDLKDELEHGDDSIARSVQRIEGETELRNFLVNQLRQVARGKYIIGQEEEMADATRTDIRFHISEVAPVPVELKIADKWVFNDFFERLENQLIKQYMQKSQYGIFLLVFRGQKHYWEDNNKNKYHFTLLLPALEEHSLTLIKNYRNVTDLKIIGIDLTIR